MQGHGLPGNLLPACFNGFPFLSVIEKSPRVIRKFFLQRRGSEGLPVSYTLKEVVVFILKEIALFVKSVLCFSCEPSNFMCGLEWTIVARVYR